MRLYAVLFFLTAAVGCGPEDPVSIGSSTRALERMLVARNLTRATVVLQCAVGFTDEQGRRGAVPFETPPIPPGGMLQLEEPRAPTGFGGDTVSCRAQKLDPGAFTLRVTVSGQQYEQTPFGAQPYRTITVTEIDTTGVT
jgi:hypothetical protein